MEFRKGRDEKMNTSVSLSITITITVLYCTRTD